MQIYHVIEVMSFTSLFSLFPFPILFLGPIGQEKFLEAGYGVSGKASGYMKALQEW